MISFKFPSVITALYVKETDIIINVIELTTFLSQPRVYRITNYKLSIKDQTSIGTWYWNAPQLNLSIYYQHLDIKMEENESFGWSGENNRNSVYRKKGSFSFDEESESVTEYIPYISVVFMYKSTFRFGPFSSTELLFHTNFMRHSS